MSFRISGLVAGGLLTVVSVAAAQRSTVRVMAAPHAKIADIRSVHVLPTPLRHDRAPRRGQYDPMAPHSRANRALWTTVERELFERGYVDAEWMPDAVVAIYASVDERLDLDAGPYGYTHAPHWWSLGGFDQSPTLFSAGTVLVDVVDPETLDVLWRGTALATIGADPLENTREVIAVASAIIQRLPRVKPVVVAKGR
jgi:hypothetical protein